MKYFLWKFIILIKQIDVFYEALFSSKIFQRFYFAKNKVRWHPVLNSAVTTQANFGKAFTDIKVVAKTNEFL